jgi:hypothetical protein
MLFSFLIQRRQKIPGKREYKINFRGCYKKNCYVLMQILLTNNFHRIQPEILILISTKCRHTAHFLLIKLHKKQQTEWRLLHLERLNRQPVSILHQFLADILAAICEAQITHRHKCAADKTNWRVAKRWARIITGRRARCPTVPHNMDSSVHFIKCIYQCATNGIDHLL